MKTIVSKVFATILLFAASFQLATAKEIDPKAPAGGIAPTAKFAYSLYALSTATKFRLTFENQEASPVKVKVFNQAGKLVYTDHIKGATELKRNYDLSSLGRGVYTVEISNGEFKTSDRVAVGGATLNPLAFNAYISSFLTDGTFKVAYEGGSEGVYIAIKDAKGTLLYSAHNVSDNFACKYNLSSLKSGSYTVVVESNDKSVEQAFVVK
jgi:Secretion system C-terminal sorting domain